ncbi:hypothetical protein V1264_009625 [Littorina saxatilis]
MGGLFAIRVAMKEGVIWTFLLGVLLSGVGRVTSQQESACAQSVDVNCGQSFGAALAAAGPDLQQACTAVDVMVGCAANAVQGCDVIDTATVIDGIKSNVINNFVTPCQLVNASLPAYQESECSLGLGLCFGVLSDAEVPTNTGLPPGGAVPQVDTVRACL